MSRTPFPFHAEDISALARSLKGQLDSCDHTPGHVDVLNMLARSTGYRNFQHLRAQVMAQADLDTLAAPEPPVDYVKIKRLLRLFDAQGRLRHWPPRQSERERCLWVLWSALPPREAMSEKAVNERINALHLFADHALLRRWLVDQGLVVRTPDGREYRRIERRPSVDAAALIRYLKVQGGEA